MRNTLPALALLAILLSPIIFVGSANAVTSQSVPPCQGKLKQDLSAQESSIDRTKAISLAANSPQYQSISQGYVSSFHSIVDIWSYDSNCNATWETLNVVFSLATPTRFVGHLIAAEDPSITKLFNVTLQEGIPQFYSSIANTNYAGYAFTGNSGGTNPVYEASASWTVPTANLPPNGCSFYHCDIAIWPGLMNDLAGNNGIVQAGTDSGISCYPGCQTSYYGWYNLYPGGSSPGTGTQCPNFPVNAGDSVFTDIYNHAAGGGSPTVYDIMVNDYTTGKICNVPNQSFSFQGGGLPYWGGFIGERPYYGFPFYYYARLPNFGSFTMTGSVFYSGVLQSIYYPYTATPPYPPSGTQGWYQIKWMVNAGTENNCAGYNQPSGSNICVGTVTGSGSFIQTWASSTGT